MRKLVIVFLVAVLCAAGLSATHSWGTYHWARTANPFTLVVVNSTTSDWDPYVSQAIGDWSASSVLNLNQDPNGSTSTKDRRQCNAQAGQILVCNLAYGNNGWLGIAGISIDSNGHITRGYTKLNDTYFDTATYNSPNWKQSVTCQEIGHDLGLDHQNEDFNNQSLFSCMDYQNPPYEYPNTHDYQQLVTIYTHLDSYDSYDTGGGGGGGCNAPPGKGCNKSGIGQGVEDPPGWGISVGRRGQQETFIRIDPDGTRHVTFVTWAQGF